MFTKIGTAAAENAAGHVRYYLCGGRGHAQSKEGRDSDLHRLVLPTRGRAGASGPRFRRRLDPAGWDGDARTGKASAAVCTQHGRACEIDAVPAIYRSRDEIPDERGRAAPVTAALAGTDGRWQQGRHGVVEKPKIGWARCPHWPFISRRRRAAQKQWSHGWLWVRIQQSSSAQAGRRRPAPACQ